VSFDLTGNVALVTGCRRGIGLTMAEALAAAGANIVGTSLTLDAGDSEARRRVVMAFAGWVAPRTLRPVCE